MIGEDKNCHIMLKTRKPHNSIFNVSSRKMLL